MTDRTILHTALTIAIACAGFFAPHIAHSTQLADPSILWACKGITIDQTGPKSISVGGRLDYDIRINNSGDCDLSGASVVDFIPRMSTFFQASPEPTEYPALRDDANEHPVSRIEWKNVSLGAGKSVVFKVSAHVQSPEDRILLNTVCFENNQTGRICSQVETNVLRQP